MTSDRPDVEAFARDGFCAPIQIYTAEECCDLFRLVTSSGKPRPKSWEKGNAVSNELFYRAGCDPRIVGLVTSLLGPDVILWGARTVIKRPGEVHAFHTDIESSAASGRFVSVWIGLDNIDRGSGLKFIAGSHRFGKSIQQLEVQNGASDVDEDQIVSWAAAFTPSPRPVQPDVAEGTALIFDGRVWHGSHNPSATSWRTALLLQYAASSEPIHMPKDFNAWPPQFELRKRPPVITVSGASNPQANRVVDPPEMRSLRPLGNSSHPVGGFRGTPAPFRSLHHLEGATKILDCIESHSSILAPGACPHPLHWHEEEELLVIVSGKAGLHIANDAQGTNERIEVLAPGDFVYYPAFQHHTLRNLSDVPLEYTMFKWRNNAPKTNFDTAPEAQLFRSGDELANARIEQRFHKLLLERKTHWLGTLHAHLSALPPKAGYKAHADQHDVAIVLLAGKVKSLGRTISAPAILFHPAGKKHGLRCASEDPARYIVFEFHGQATGARLPYQWWRLRREAPGHARDGFAKRLSRKIKRIVRGA